MLSRAALMTSRWTPVVRAVALKSLSTTPLLAQSGDVKHVATQRTGLTGFLYEKTGVTGAWILGAGLTALALSKEYYIINSEAVLGTVVFGVCYWLIKKVGPDVGKSLDARSEEILAKFNEGKFAKINTLEESIADQRGLGDMLECRHDVFEVLKENNEMRVEEEYRRRLHVVNQEVKKRLDYQLEKEQITRRYEQEQMIQWLEKAVIDSVRGKEEQSVSQCVAELKAMSV